MKDKIITALRILEELMKDVELMKVVNTMYENPLGHDRDSLMLGLGKILAKEALT